jgi:hypothetical protein
MQQEKITILQYLQKRGGLLVVRNPIELGLTAKAFVVAVQSLCRHGLVEQDGLASAVLSGKPVTLRLTKVRVSAIEEVQPAETAGEKAFSPSRARATSPYSLP